MEMSFIIRVYTELYHFRYHDFVDGIDTTIIIDPFS